MKKFFSDINLPTNDMYCQLIDSKFNQSMNETSFKKKYFLNINELSGENKKKR